MHRCRKQDEGGELVCGNNNLSYDMFGVHRERGRDRLAEEASNTSFRPAWQAHQASQALACQIIGRKLNYVHEYRHVSGCVSLDGAVAGL